MRQLHQANEILDMAKALHGLDLVTDEQLMTCQEDAQEAQELIYAYEPIIDQLLSGCLVPEPDQNPDQLRARQAHQKIAAEVMKAQQEKEDLLQKHDVARRFQREEWARRRRAKTLQRRRARSRSGP